MTLDEETRFRRAKNWKAYKRTWEVKLAAASNEQDIAVAKARLAEVEKIIMRLEVIGGITREEAAYEKRNIDPIVKSIKADREKRDSSAPQKEDEGAGAIGL
jgi:ribosomal protein S20